MLIVGGRFLPSALAVTRSRRLDLSGVVLASLATFALVYPLVQGRELGWPLWIKLMLAASLPLLAAFAGLYFVLSEAGAGIGHWDLVLPLLIAGIGMGMVFVPLFDIILGGVLQALQQLGMSLGVAALGTLFFGLLGEHSDRATDFVAAAEQTTLASIALVALAFVVGFALPRHARGHAAQKLEPVPA